MTTFDSMVTNEHQLLKQFKQKTEERSEFSLPITNLPSTKVSASDVCTLYSIRWRIDTVEIINGDSCLQAGENRALSLSYVWTDDLFIIAIHSSLSYESVTVEKEVKRNQFIQRHQG